MRSSILLFLILSIVCSCVESTISNISEKQIVISERDSIIKFRRDSMIKADSSMTFPPKSHYVGINFIIDETSLIYFHNKDGYSQLDEPPFVDLKKEDIVVLSYADVKDFVDSIYHSSDTSLPRWVQISSTTDSINMRSFEILSAQLDVKRKFYKIPLRLITEEENGILKQFKQ